ncbi:hypothetical protein MRX96_010125 [Rhipicephalus microplus]
MKFITYVSDAVTDNFVTRYVRGYTHGAPSHASPPPHELSRPPSWACHLVKSGGGFVRLAGLSGALAVALGAYGAHALFKRDDVPEELKEAYDRANHYHFLHTLALLGVPLTRRPALVGSLLLVGMGLFCGSLLILAWLSILL